MAELIGYSITVVSYDEQLINEAHRKAKQLFDSISIHEVVTPIMKGQNNMKTFFIAPDFSKPSFETNKLFKKARELFFGWMTAMDNYSEVRKIIFFETQIDLEGDDFEVANTLDKVVIK